MARTVADDLWEMLHRAGVQNHLAEAGLHPREPVFFAKLRSAVIGRVGALTNPLEAGWKEAS